MLINKQAIRERLKKIRIDNELTQTEFAKRLGLSCQYISAIEQGKQLPSFNFLRLIVEKIDNNISVDWLLGRTDTFYVKENDLPAYWEEYYEGIHTEGKEKKLKPRIALRWISRKDTILRLRKEGASLRDIGERYGVTRERIRQILRIYEHHDKQK